LDSQVLRDTNVLIATTEKADEEKKKALEKKGIEFVILNSPPLRGKSSWKTFQDPVGMPKRVRHDVSLSLLLQHLHKHKILSILVEGGSQVIGSFVDEKLIDKVYSFHAPIIIGGTNAISAVGGNGSEKVADAMRLQDVSFKKFGDNVVTIGYPKL